MAKRSKSVHGPLISAALAEDEQATKAAIAAGEDVNETDDDGRTALHHAVISKAVRLVVLLLEAGANVSAQDREGWTPLHFAAQSQDVETAELLLRKGALVDSIDVHGNTPLFRGVFDARGRGELIGLLLRAGADKHKKNKHGVSPLDLANTIANYDTKKWLA